MSTDSFQLLVKTLTGKTVPVSVSPRDTIDTLKEKLYAKEGVPKDLQRLIFGGKPLDDAKRISEYGIQKLSTVFLVTTLIGGGSMAF
jgi:hypothetical protein